MNTEVFSKSFGDFTKSPLGIIALFIVLVYGFASLVVGIGQGISAHLVPLIYFMVFFPILVFLGFLWLVAIHSNKLYGPSDFKNEDNFIKMQMTSVAALAAATIKQSGQGPVLSDAQLYEIVDVVSNSTEKMETKKRQRKILWVDDCPENNLSERQAFEAQGIDCSLALSTTEALRSIQRNKYAVIISDMGRKEGMQEGYILLEKLKDLKDKTPFIIYANSSAPEYKKKTNELGAAGSTNRADELFKLVINNI